MKLNLTICIPTYNRPDLLSECLDSVIYSISLSKSNVKILVSDNCSDLSCEKIIDEKKNRFSNIQYFRNKKNVRDLNFYLCAKRAKTEYVWIFSDDDIMKENSILTLEKLVERGDNLIVCNYSLFDYSLNKCLKKNFFKTNKKKNYDDCEEVMRNFGFRLSFLSCIIFKRKHFLKLPESTFSEHVKYQFPFLLSIYYMIKNHCKLKFIETTLIIQRANKVHAKKEWWYKIFVNGSNKVFKFLNNLGYSNSSIRFAKRKMIYEDIINDLVFRRLNNESLINKSILIIKNYYNYPFELILMLIVIFVPRILIITAYKLYKIG